MSLRLLLAAVLLLAAPAVAAGVHDAGPTTLRGHATDLVERRALVDLWDAGQPARTWALRLLPDSDALAVEARLRPVNGANGTWVPLTQLALTTGPDRKAEDRGWDGRYELALRLRLPNQPGARLAVLLAPSEGADAVALTTHLAATPLSLRTAVEHRSLLAWVEGGKAPQAMDAFVGAQRTAMQGADGTWRLPAMPAAGEVRVVARFADGGALEATVPVSPSPPPAPEAAEDASRDEALQDAPPPSAPDAKPEPAQRAAPRTAPQERASASVPVRGVPGLPISLALAALGAAALGRRVAFK